MVAAIQYDSKVWTAGVVSSRAGEPGERCREQAWHDLDRQLRAVAARRAALDAEELALIRKAIAIQIWRPLGMTSMREYLEHVMGYGPQVAAERLRVSDALEGLPAIERALGSGALSYSAVRELTRIATRKTEHAWLDATRGKTLRQIEELVAEREPGDGPETPPKPELRPKRVSMDLLPEVIALMRRAQAALDAARGERTDHSELLGEAFQCLLAMHAGGDAADARGARSVTQTATITTCEGCGQGWQLAAGRKIAITAAELERAECDAVHIGSLDGAPARASSTIPPAIHRFVMHRDGEKCTVPGCRSSQNLELHHIVHREYGGTNEPENLTVLCWGHHAAHHRGELHIAGEAPAISVTRSPAGPPRGGLRAPKGSRAGRPRGRRARGRPGGPAGSPARGGPGQRHAPRADDAWLHERSGSRRGHEGAGTHRTGRFARDAGARRAARMPTVTPHGCRRSALVQGSLARAST